MKQTVFRYGLYSAITILILAAIAFFGLSGLSFSQQEVAGYLTMLLAMIFVFLGIRHYRDHVNGGMLSFGEGMKVGVLILLIPSVFFGLFDVLYTTVINPGWSDQYFGHYVEELKKSASPEKLQQELNSLQKQKEFFSQPVMQFLVMAVTVFIVGLIVTIISSIALRRSKTAIA